MRYALYMPKLILDELELGITWNTNSLGKYLSRILSWVERSLLNIQNLVGFEAGSNEKKNEIRLSRI